MTRGRPQKEERNSVFSERLGILLRSRGMTQRELADKAGCHPSMVCKYVKGDGTPEIGALVKIVKALGVSSDYLLGLTSRPTQRI